MALSDIFNPIVDPFMRPLLSLDPLWAIIIVSLVVSIISTLAYKWMVDQHLMKTLKEDLKKINKELRKLKPGAKEWGILQKKMKKKSMEQMKQSFKPTLLTMLPLLIIFGWMYGNMAFYPIGPGTEFTTTLLLDEGFEGNATIEVPQGVEVINNETTSVVKNGIAEWKLKAEAGEYQLGYNFKSYSYNTEVLISSERRYKDPEKKLKEGPGKLITVSYEKVITMTIPFVEWEIGWLGAYIIFSIIFSMGLRKIMKLH